MVLLRHQEIWRVEFWEDALENIGCLELLKVTSEALEDVLQFCLLICSALSWKQIGIMTVRPSFWLKCQFLSNNKLTAGLIWSVQREYMGLFSCLLSCGELSQSSKARQLLSLLKKHTQRKWTISPLCDTLSRICSFVVLLSDILEGWRWSKEEMYIYHWF